MRRSSTAHLPEYHKLIVPAWTELAFFSPNAAASPTNPNIANYEAVVDLNALIRTRMFGASPALLVGVNKIQIRSLSSTVSVRVTSSTPGKSEVVLADGGGMFHLNHQGAELVDVYLEHDKVTTLADFPDEATAVPRYGGSNIVANLELLTAFSDAHVNSSTGLPTLLVMNEQRDSNTFVPVPKNELMQDIASLRTYHSGARIENPSLLPRQYFEVFAHSALYSLVNQHAYAISLKHGEVALLTRRNGGGGLTKSISSSSSGSSGSILISDDARVTMIQRVIEPIVQVHAKHCIACDKGEPLPKILIQAVASGTISVCVHFNVWIRDELKRDGMSIPNSSNLGSESLGTSQGGKSRAKESLGGAEDRQRGSCMLQ